MRRWWWIACGAMVLSGCSPEAPPAGEPGAVQPDAPVADQPPIEDIEATVVTVYFPDQELTRLETEAVDAPASASDPVELAKAAVTALLAGPTESVHVRVLPAQLTLRDLTITDGEATVDFSKELTEGSLGGSNVAALAVDSIVNTVCAIEGVKSVRILVEGQPVSDFQGVLDLSEPQTPNEAIVGGKPL